MPAVKASAKAADDPRSMGIYPLADAGRLLHSSPATLRSWVSKGLAPGPPEVQGRELLSFHDLISLLVVRELRHRAVSLKGISTAYRYLVSELGLDRPFARQRFWTSGQDVFVKLRMALNLRVVCSCAAISLAWSLSPGFSGYTVAA